MRTFNIIRYSAAIVLPLIILICFGQIWFAVSVIAVLFANNFVDDIVFYYGSAYLEGSYDAKGIVSPVEGIVTCVEESVPMYNHLTKNEILTKEELVEWGTELGDGSYNHVAIFLNKLNKHLVASLYERVQLRELSLYEENLEMVENGKLIADNKGWYLSNTFVELVYPNDVHVIVTMDKYISKAVIPTERKAVEMLICRGSQCDIYVPDTKKIAVSPYQRVDVLQKLFENEVFNKFKTADVYRDEVFECINKSGFNLKDSFKENLLKTASTWKHNDILALILVYLAVLNPFLLFLWFGLYIYLFLFDRSVKNGLYALMNIIGYKEWMTKIYNSLHKLLLYGK